MRERAPREPARPPARPYARPYAMNVAVSYCGWSARNVIFVIPGFKMNAAAAAGGIGGGGPGPGPPGGGGGGGGCWQGSGNDFDDFDAETERLKKELEKKMVIKIVFCPNIGPRRKQSLQKCDVSLQREHQELKDELAQINRRRQLEQDRKRKEQRSNQRR